MLPWYVIGEALSPVPHIRGAIPDTKWVKRPSKPAPDSSTTLIANEALCGLLLPRRSSFDETFDIMLFEEAGARSSY